MPELLPRVMTAAALRSLGFTDARVRTELRRGRWRRLAPGIFLTRPDEPTRFDWINAGACIGGPTSVLSGWDAARRFQLGPAQPPTSEVLILTSAGRNRVVGRARIRPSARAIGAVRTSALDQDLPSVQIAAPARAVADTALQLAFRQPVRAMITSAVQRQLCTPAELADELDAGPQNGSGHLRKALADVLAGARSIAEAEAIELLRGAAVPAFLVNAPICDEQGRLVAVADLLWPQLSAIVEIDSREFHFSEDDWKQTMHRHNALTVLGYAVAHYAPGEIRRRGPRWAAEVGDWLAALSRNRGTAP